MIIKQECSGVYTFFANPNPKSKEERIKWLDDFIEHVQKEQQSLKIVIGLQPKAQSRPRFSKWGTYDESIS